MVKTAASLRLVVGAEGIFDKGWIPTDIEYLNFLNKQHWERYFKKDSIDVILAEHFWEHLTTENALMAAQQCFQYLRPGGYLRVAVPDGYHPDPKYIE
jgi:predicted SAM-dependent methyltransferase